MKCDYCNDTIESEAYRLRSLRFCHSYHGFLFAKTKVELGDKTWDAHVRRIQKLLVAGVEEKPQGARTRILDVGLPDARRERI